MCLALLTVMCAGVALPLQAQAQTTAPSVYWGANVGDHLTGGAVPYDMTAADKFAAIAGRRTSLMHFVQAWGDCSATPCKTRPFPTKQMEAIRQAGAIPVFGWVSFSTPLDGSSQPDYQLSDVIDGTYDSYIRQWAQAAKAWGHPFFLTLDPEMNLISTWPYVEARNGNKPGEFVRMWRHVHDIFRQEGVTNATWNWCANVEFPNSAPLGPLYPGDDYVDWTCMDGYNWYWGWQSPAEVFAVTYEKIQDLAPDKPMLIGETASSEKNGSKAAWIKDLFRTQLPERFPNVKGIVWYEKKDPKITQDPGGWLVESSQASIDAFRSAIASPYYADPVFADLPGTKIKPLSPIVRRTSSGGSGGSAGGGGSTTGGSGADASLAAARSYALPVATRCVRRGAVFTLRYRALRGVKVMSVRVMVRGRLVLDRKGARARRSFRFRRLTTAPFVIRVHVRTASGHRATIVRRYRICPRT